jgi:hypothetical protein
MAGNTAMLPNPDDSAFQTVTAGENPNTAGAAADRSLVLHPGTYTIKVQVQVLDDNTVLYLIGSHLNVQTADYGVSPGTAPGQKDPGKHPIMGH